jgi:hypothetical protein
MMASLIGIIASPVIERVGDTDSKGRQFLSPRPLYGAVGWWLYQQGGILGFSLKGERRLVEKIMSMATHNPMDDVDVYKDSITADLESVKNREKHITWLYTYLEMKKIGVDLTNQEGNHSLPMIDPKQTREVMKEAFYKGVTIGFHFPDLFKEYWENTYQKLVENETNKGSKRSSTLSKTQLELAFGEAVIKVINTIFNWNQLEGYEVLNREDESTLENILNDFQKIKHSVN